MNEAGAIRLTIVTVNRDDFSGLKETIASVGCQSRLVGVEHIVIDSSRDAEQVKSLVESEGNSSTRLIYSPAQGVYSAMNLGLKFANGEYIHFLNSGDCYHDDRVVDRALDFISSEGPEWFYGSISLTSRKGLKRIRGSNWNYTEEKRRRFRRGKFPLQPAIFVKKAVLERINGFPDNWKIAADYAVMLQLSKVTDPYILDIIVTVFKADGLSSKRWILSLREAFQIRALFFHLKGFSKANELILSLPYFMRVFLAKQGSKFRDFCK